MAKPKDLPEQGRTLEAAILNAILETNRLLRLQGRHERSDNMDADGYCGGRGCWCRGVVR